MPTAHAASSRGLGSRQARRNVHSDREARNAKSAYTRASCEYQTNSGLKATIAVRTIAVRREPSSRPIAHAAATVATPASADNERRATAPAPKTRDHAQISTYQSGGEFSLWIIACRVEPSEACSTCTGV